MSTKLKNYKLTGDCQVTAIQLNDPPPRGSIWTAETNEEIQEAVALVAAGYATETNEAATVQTRSQRSRTPLTGIVDAGDKNADPEHDAELLEILELSINGVAEKLADLSPEDLIRLAELELSGQKRKGVAEAIATAQAKNAE